MRIAPTEKVRSSPISRRQFRRESLVRSFRVCALPAYDSSVLRSKSLINLFCSLCAVREMADRRVRIHA